VHVTCIRCVMIWYDDHCIQ